ncbi:serine/threonine protein kinase-like protein [Dermatophagoides farinae]|uniref:Serine/threonine-protein kinase ULK3 n=1 Tax=Dermatophagoides farinae TaxID=6954 RepID=A0A9D4P5W8_DERFA|nr:serine/threonine protein kinase-like protein [Dermatophagoides farinae]
MDPKSNNNAIINTTTNVIINSSSSPNSSLPPPKVDGYRLNHLIGKGSYGHVFRAEKKISHEVVAIKCVPLKSLSKNSRDNIINEISILKKLKHEFIVQMLDFQWDKAFVYMIFEFCPSASAMKYLRDNDVAHLDLKPQNILITGIQFVTLLNGLNSFKVWRQVILKIADFGFAQYLSNDESVNSLRGSPLYMAPEIFKKHEYDARVDLWSIGIILYECLFGRTPLHGMTTAEITHAYQRNQVHIEFPKNRLSQLCYDLLGGLLKIDPKMRISFSNFFTHPFIDLEHMPMADSFEKARNIISKAMDFETKGEYKSAFYNFRDALLYLMPLYRWGLPTQPYSAKKREQLRQMIVENMEKAEELQQKCGIVNINPKLLQEIQSIYNRIDRARDLASKDLYSQSLDEFELAFDQSFKIMKENDQKIRNEFFGEISEWMTEAEIVKDKYLTEQQIKQQLPKKIDLDLVFFQVLVPVGSKTTKIFMMTKKIALVAACCRSNGIGKDGNLPWRLRSEMDFFTRITSTVLDSAPGLAGDEQVKKNAVIMGTRTYMSIPPSFRPLKNRVNVVLSRTINEAPAGVEFLFRSLDEAVKKLSEMPNIDQLYVIGGSEVYNESVARSDCDLIFLTKIDADFDCDRFFPSIDLDQYEDITDEKLLEKYRHIIDKYDIPLDVQKENGLSFRYHLYKRK